jgi:DNA-binding MarR family transcriptional regulator
MRKRDESAKPHPLATSGARTFTSGGVPVRRSPISLARRFFQICTTASAEATVAENLTPLQGGVLAYLNKVDGEPGIDQNGLAARMGIDRARASQLVDELEARGIVERRVNGADRRARLLRLTPRGEKVRVRLRGPTSAGQMRVFAALTDRERDLFLDLLVRLVESNNTLARPGAGRRKRGYREASPQPLSSQA